jgi:hypothetical protein
MPDYRCLTPPHITIRAEGALVSDTGSAGDRLAR